MEKSEKFGFILPSRDADDIADINQISDNFRIIDENIPSKDELKNEMEKEKIIVDQTYNLESENAQSGVAVAQAIDGTSSAIINTTPKSYNIEILDSADRKIKKIKLYGGLKTKNLLPKATNATIKGITFTVNSDGSIFANGTANSDSAVFYLIVSNKVYPAGTYTLSGCPSGFGSNVRIYNDGKGLEDFGEGSTITITEDTNWAFYIRIQPGFTANNLVFYPQLERGAVATDYEPYEERFVENPTIEILNDTPQSVTILGTFQDGDFVIVENKKVKTMIGGIETDITNTETGQNLINLHTNYPVTTIVADGDVEVDYIADTKNYIKNQINAKFAELQALILEG